ncbi:MAG: ribonuclease HII [Pseudobdellovibrio sp.]
MNISIKYLKSLPQPLIGIDEVGRGCLAGPVYAAAVIFKSKIDIETYFDSKTIKEDKRQKLAESVLANHSAEIGIATVEEIDEINIRQATFLAMKRAAEKIIKKHKIKTGTLLIDGRDTIPKLGLFEQLAIIKGDQKVRVISAASLVAKVARDQFMTELSSQFEDYGFARHKGYGTEFHRQQIQIHGPTAWHRQTFSGVKEYI